MENNLYLSTENLEEIKRVLQLELLKRGITAPIVELKETLSKNGSSHYIQFQTAEFQTVPVLFKRLQVNNFGSSVVEKMKSELKLDLEGSFISVWINVHYSYESFGGGSNGTELFNIWFNIFGKTSYDVKLNQIL